MALNSEVSNNNTSLQRSNGEKMRIFTGNISKVIKWYQTYNNNFWLAEVIAPVVSVQASTNDFKQQLILLRDPHGPILQVIRYPDDHLDLPENSTIQIGQTLRCVGRMIQMNKLHGLSIRLATPDELATLQKMSYICDHAIEDAIRNNN